MSTARTKHQAIFERRRSRLLKELKGQAALFCSPPECTLSRDQHFPFRQDSDLLYLLGLDEPSVALLLRGSSSGPRSVLFLRERVPELERWVGESLGHKRAKRRFKIDEVRPYEQLARDLPSLLCGLEVLHYAAGTNPQTDRVVWDSYRTPVGPRMSFPHTIRDARVLTSQLRCKKSREELQSLRHACEISAKGLRALAPQLPRVKSERHAARLLEAHFAEFGASEPSFETIVASGKNATVLHHHPSMQPLWRRELVLIDAGARFNGYAGDITRVFPVSGQFSEAQALVYDAVHLALKAGLERAIPGSDLDAVHDAAVRSLVRSLIKLGVIDASPAQAINEKLYRPYYMHRTGHWLGLDVHDIAPIHADEFLVPPYSRPLEVGNVFTIEPGLYFDPKDTTVPPALRGIGIRLEEDVVITHQGHEVLTSSMPIERADIEMIMKGN